MDKCALHMELVGRGAPADIIILMSIASQFCFLFKTIQKKVFATYECTIHDKNTAILACPPLGASPPAQPQGLFGTANFK